MIQEFSDSLIFLKINSLASNIFQNIQEYFEKYRLIEITLLNNIYFIKLTDVEDLIKIYDKINIIIENIKMLEEIQWNFLDDEITFEDSIKNIISALNICNENILKLKMLFNNKDKK